MLDAFVWDSEAEDEWEEEESETGAIAHVVGTLVTHFFSPLVPLMLIYSLLKASIGESWDFNTGTRTGQHATVRYSSGSGSGGAQPGGSPRASAAPASAVR